VSTRRCRVFALPYFSSFPDDTSQSKIRSVSSSYQPAGGDSKLPAALSQTSPIGLAASAHPMLRTSLLSIGFPPLLGIHHRVYSAIQFPRLCRVSGNVEPDFSGGRCSCLLQGNSVADFLFKDSGVTLQSQCWLNLPTFTNKAGEREITFFTAMFQSCGPALRRRR
jgi:hypothetical protein